MMMMMMLTTSGSHVIDRGNIKGTLPSCAKLGRTPRYRKVARKLQARSFSVAVGSMFSTKGVSSSSVSFIENGRLGRPVRHHMQTGHGEKAG
jgi:hypothetical protein